MDLNEFYGRQKILQGEIGKTTMTSKRGKHITQLAKGKRLVPHKISISLYDIDIRNGNRLYWINEGRTEVSKLWEIAWHIRVASQGSVDIIVGTM